MSHVPITPCKIQTFLPWIVMLMYLLDTNWHWFIHSDVIWRKFSRNSIDNSSGVLVTVQGFNNISLASRLALSFASAPLCNMLSSLWMVTSCGLSLMSHRFLLIWIQVWRLSALLFTACCFSVIPTIPPIAYIIMLWYLTIMQYL